MFSRISWEERKRLLLRQGWIVVVVTQPILLLAYLLPADIGDGSLFSIRVFWCALLFRTATFHLAAALLVIAVTALIAGRWRLTLAAAPLSLIAVAELIGAAWPNTPTTTQPEQVRFMSINLLVSNRKYEPILREISEVDPDVIGIQELSPGWKTVLGTHLSQRYPHRNEISRIDSFGAAIYSKLPIITSQRLALGKSGVPAIRAEIELPSGDRWVVWNIHTLPPRLATYVATQHNQAKDLARRLAHERLPTLLCGDFNWNEYTSYHERIRELGFTEGHAEAGRGFGANWHTLGWSRLLPGIRIDHLYAGNGLHFIEHHTGHGEGSDHRPVIATLARSRQVTRDTTTAPTSP